MSNLNLYKAYSLFLSLIFCGVIQSSSLAASSVYATNTIPLTGNKVVPCGGFILSGCVPTVKNPNNANADNGAYSRLYASPGGLVSYNAKIELRFDDAVPANTTTYIRIDGDKKLLESLLGGSLGNFLNGVLGSVLIGRQNILIEARSSSGSVMTPNSSLNGFDNNLVKLVIDEFGNSYLAVSPTSDYDRIWITNQALAVVGLGSEYTLDIYHAFYFEHDPCDLQPAFTSFDGSGITLDALGLNSQVESLNLAIDDDLESTFSEISLGVVGLAGSMEQLIYFNSPVQPGNEILISMATGESLLDLGLLNYVDLIMYSNGAEVSSVSASSLLELDVLGLLASDKFFKFPVSSDISPIDQIGIRMSSLVGLGVLEGSLHISGATVAPIRPGVDTIPVEGQFVICQGETVTVTPNNKAGGDLNWYRLDSSTEVPMGTADAYTTPDNLPHGDYEFLVKSEGPYCPTESDPSRFKVKVNPIPTAANYSIQPSGQIGIDEDGKYTYLEGENPITLNPNLFDWTGDGEFEWYLDELMVTKLEDGDTIGDILYQVDNGNLTMTGLEFRDELDSYKFYLNWVPTEGCGPAEPMRLNLSSVARILNVSLLSFEAIEINKGQVKIDWSFAGIHESETIKLNRAGFDLEFVELASFSSHDIDRYSFIDLHPLTGNNYYRLEVVNKFGNSRFISQLVRFQIASNSNENFRIYPNDFENEITIVKEKDGNIEAVLVLYSGEGSLLKIVDFNFTGEVNKYIITDMTSYPSGNFILQIIWGKERESFHLLKK